MADQNMDKSQTQKSQTSTGKVDSTVKPGFQREDSAQSERPSQADQGSQIKKDR